MSGDPVILLPAVDLTDDHPQPGARQLASVRKVAARAGWVELDARFAVALVWRKRKMPGVSGPGSMRSVQLPIMSVAARWRSADRSTLAYLTWTNESEEGWRAGGGSIISRSDGIRYMLDEAMRDYLAGGGLARQ